SVAAYPAITTCPSTTTLGVEKRDCFFQKLCNPVSILVCFSYCHFWPLKVLVISQSAIRKRTASLPLQANRKPRSFQHRQSEITVTARIVGLSWIARLFRLVFVYHAVILLISLSVRELGYREKARGWDSDMMCWLCIRITNSQIDEPHAVF